MQQHTRLTFCLWPWFSLQPRSLCLLIFAWLLLPSTLWLAQSARQGVGLGEEKQQIVNKLKSINPLVPQIDFSGFLPNLASYPSLGSSYEVLSHWWSWDVLIYKSKLWKEGIFLRVNFFLIYLYISRPDNTFIFFICSKYHYGLKKRSWPESQLPAPELWKWELFKVWPWLKSKQYVCVFIYSYKTQKASKFHKTSKIYLPYRTVFVQIIK